jgi:hypothetical protein
MKSKQSSIPQNNNNNEPEKTSGSAVSDKKIRGNKKIEDDDDLFGIEERKREIEERKQRDVSFKFRMHAVSLAKFCFFILASKYGFFLLLIRPF